MEKLSSGKLLIKLIFVLSLFLLSLNSSLQAADSPDAIAFRVMPNAGHLSPLRWYQDNIKLKGSPQALTVDGYEAVRDGRTVYVNAANIDIKSGHCSKNQAIACTGESCKSEEGYCVPSFYSNIYIISYNQQAERQTVDIFGQILANWKFNTNISDADPTASRCSKTASRACFYSSECPSGEYCLSLKAKIIRDTKRLADLSNLKLSLDNYQKARDGNYPALAAGSYLAGKSLSVWPSWQATLGKELSAALPVDPVNRLGVCNSDPAVNKLYDPVACWDQANKKFADPTPANNELNLPANSRAYVYQYNADGSYQVCAVMETGYLTTPQGACAGSFGAGYTSPVAPQSITINCGDLKGYECVPFTGFVSATYSGAGTLNWQIISSSLDGWDPMTIQKMDAPNQAKLSSSYTGTGSLTEYSVNIKAVNALGVSAQISCPIVIGRCGDNEVNGGGETCDNGDTGANKNGTVCSAAGDLGCTYCDDNCQLQVVSAPSCGDGVKNGQEKCDNGDNNTDVPCQASYGSTCNYCDKNCIERQIEGAKCGDGEKNGGEECDYKKIYSIPGVEGKDKCTGLTTVPTYCDPSGKLTVEGEKTCNNLTCKWNTCDLTQPIISSVVSCDPKSKALSDFACCELVGCAQDGCGCCGSQEADVTPGFTTKISLPSVYSNKILGTFTLDGNKCGGGYFDGTIYTESQPPPPYTAIADLCTSCRDKAVLPGCFPPNPIPPAPLPVYDGCWLDGNSCKLNLSDSNDRIWELSINHSTALYRCWR